MFPEPKKSGIQKLNIDNSTVGNRTAKEATENIVIDINSEVENKKQGSQVKQDKKQGIKQVSFQDGKHMIDDNTEKNESTPQKKEKFNRLKSPPPPLATITDSSDEDQRTNIQLSEILDFMKTIQGKLTQLEKNYGSFQSEVSEIKTRLDVYEVKNVCNDLIQMVETTKDTYD